MIDDGRAILLNQQSSIDNTTGRNEMANIVGKRYVCTKCGAEGTMSKLGKRYKCEVCGTELLCTKAGEGTFVCCEQEMKVQEPKPLPSSD
jgi:desulfoferrodoxin-like iron-binding protein